MRHRLKGRHLGRNGSHRNSLLRNLARCLVLSCDVESSGTAKVRGRIRTTLEKAKEARPFVEKLVTTAVKAKVCFDEASRVRGDYEQRSSEYRIWRLSEEGQVWLRLQGRYIHYRRLLFSVLRCDKTVVMFIEQIAPQFMGRLGGYTRVVRLAKRRLGDAAKLAYLEFVYDPSQLVVDKP